MRIALDYDGTITADPTLWIPFIAYAQHRGHTVTIVTWRSNDGHWDNTELERYAKLVSVDVIYCDLKQKSECFNADVWIDDNPSAIPSAYRKL